jgi:uncharacterized protein (TIGR02217 family)
MSFHDVLLPPELSYGFESGPTLATVVQTTASGHEYRVARQSQARHRYRANKANLSPDQFAALKAFWMGRRGALHSFRFKDWTDFSTAANGVGAPSKTDSDLGTGDGTTQHFQLVKVYDKDGPNPYQRTITLPDTSTLVLAVDGVPVSSGFTVSANTGVITFSTPPANGVKIQAGFQFDVPVRFSSSSDDWLRSTYDAFQLITTPGIELIEVLDEVEWPELWYPGGSKVLTPSTDVVLEAGTKLWSFNASQALSVYLPAPDRIPGGHLFTLTAAAGSQTITIRDDAGNALGLTLTSGITRQVYLLRSGSTASWLVA